MIIRRIGSLFGSHGNEMVERYRRCDRLASEIKMLKEEIAELQTQRSNFYDEHGSRSEALSTRVDELLHQRNQLEKQLTDDLMQKKSLEQSIGVFWKHWIVWIQNFLASDSLTVSQREAEIQRLTGEIATHEQTLQDLSSQIHDTTHQHQRLAIPLESFDFAIQYLQKQLSKDQQEFEEQHQAIDLAIRTLAKSNSPRLLSIKSTEFSSEMVDTLLDLKETLARLDGLNSPADDDMIEAELFDDDSPSEQAPISIMEEAIRSGYSEQRTRHTGKVFVEGSGTTHVQKTRSVTESYTDANGNPSTRSRNETYWDKTQVDLSGPVQASFDVVFQQWNSSAILDAVQRISRVEFHQGKKQVSEGFKTQRAELAKRVEHLTAAIRQEIEAD